MSKTINPEWMEWLWKLLRVFLGVVFVYASAEKIINPEQFAYAISNYKLLPAELVSFIALVLPWLEATIGIFLIVGIFEWVSLSLYNILMVIFLAAIAISLARGLNISCGCFTSDPNAEKMTWLTLLRDSSILVLGLAAYPLLLRLRRPPFFKDRRIDNSRTQMR
jgi:uncharacterized membrane protein YphA (DoxX/SURF4 family)